MTNELVEDVHFSRHYFQITYCIRDKAHYSRFQITLQQVSNHITPSCCGSLTAKEYLITSLNCFKFLIRQSPRPRTTVAKLS